MADYVPALVGSSATFVASSAIVGGRLVEVVADGAVAHTFANSASYVGVAAFSAAAGELVTVHLRGHGVQWGIAADAVAAGDPVSTVADGGVAGGSAPIGVALTSGQAGDQIKFLD